jgi:hypothetical protein
MTSYVANELDEILQIPICLQHYANFWSWHYDRRRVFIICSAYKMLVSTEDHREARLEGRAGASYVEAVWKVL